ncbi:MAG TPA: hypothetical protein VFF69_07065 [Phycisphaerales bacterium]|nr:hypothetical protein [Phycisphaerales bacterium]
MNGTCLLRRVFAGVLCLFMILPAGCEDPQAAEKEAIRAALRQLDDANEARDGAAAVAVMSSRALEEYTRLVKIALDGSKTDVQTLSPLEMLQVIQMRHRMDRRQLAAMDGKAFQEYATGEGWNSGARARWEDTIGDISVAGDTAYAEVLGTDGGDSGVQGHFEREEGVWKVNHFSFMRVWDDELRRLALQYDIGLPEMIVRFEEMATLQQIRKSIWEPMR